MRVARILLALLLAFGLFGVLTSGDMLYSRFVYASLLISLFSFLWARWAASGLGLARHTRSLRAHVGEVFQEQYDVVNNSRIPAAWIEVINQSRLPFAAGSRLFTFFTARQKRTYLARTWLTRSGFSRLEKRSSPKRR